LSLAVLITGTFMSVLDTSVVNVAMSVLTKEFGASADSVQWVSTVYNLAEGVAIPTGAWLGARFGLKRVYLVTLVLFTAASALCGMSSGLPELIAFRILQAIPGGIMPVACQTILYRPGNPEATPKRKVGGGELCGGDREWSAGCGSGSPIGRDDRYSLVLGSSFLTPRISMPSSVPSAARSMVP
jgi:MFS family permease